ncbi:galactosylceramide sulfotransferase-like isoform X2 [Branchiostoma lanceolatum]|uniref:galactosylceramide sulfotransferase-like isoform X2 n=1 Tax=Branchiostoma lanceolatum TaxID=7740 RepID=UPI003453803D
MMSTKALFILMLAIAIYGTAVYYHTQNNKTLRSGIGPTSGPRTSQDERQLSKEASLQNIVQRTQPDLKDNNTKEAEMSSKTCHPRRQFVFIKTHKTGSCTAVNIFQRYALRHSLSVLIPTGGNLLGWPFPPAEQDYVHTPDEQYDVLLNHVVYNKPWLRSKFPANTAYISIIREPSSQLRSAFNYYSLPKLLKIESQNPVQTFLQDPWKYKHLSEAYFDFCNVTWDGTRNFMSFDLGYPTEGAEDKERAHRYISELEADFRLVLLLEHLDESIVLLRRLMCWEVRDVLYDIVSKNNRSYPYKSYIPTAQELTNLRRWKAVDYLLYDTFNASLWRKITAQGPDFYEELRYFREVKKRVGTFCRTCKQRRRCDPPSLTIEASKWSRQFAVDSKYCSRIQSQELLLGKYIRERASKEDRKEWTIMRVADNVLRIVQGLPTVKYKAQAE